jgi:tripeptidyl-peptidase-1
VSPDAKKNPMKCLYSPSFPASSPYVLAVGGTMGPELEIPTAETACSSEGGVASGVITSGGGFSTLYAAQDWQKETLDGYWAGVEDGSFVRPFHGYNRGGRGLPDVSALAHNYIVAVGLELTAVSGTSASSPVMAGMISLVNAARLEAGYPSVGWIHPTLYRHHARFSNDVTSGRNNW